MSSRKSARNRCQVDYLQLLGSESDEDDLFSGETLKAPKRRKSKPDDQDFTSGSPPTLSPLKVNIKKSSKNKNSEKSGNVQKVITVSTKAESPTLTSLPLLPVTKTCAPPTVTSSNQIPKLPKPQVKNTGFTPELAAPSPSSAAAASLRVTPPSNLRIGLSRRGVVKPLHSKLAYRR